MTKIQAICVASAAALVSLILGGSAGFYAGKSTSPQAIALSALSSIAYDQQAQAEYEAELAVQDSVLAEKEYELDGVERENELLQVQVSKIQREYTSSEADFESEITSHEDKIREASFDLESAVAGNLRAQKAFGSLISEHAEEITLLRSRLNFSEEYTSALTQINTGLRNEILSLRNVNLVLEQQNTLARERVDALAKPRARHGPGLAGGYNPISSGWTIAVGYGIFWG